MDPVNQQPFDVLPAKPEGPTKQVEFKMPNASVALGIIQQASKLLLGQREKDRLVQDAYDRIPPNDPEEMRKEGREWQTNVDWGDTESAINEKVEQLNNLVTQALPYISFITRHGANINTVQALDVVAREHHYLFTQSEFWVPELQNMLHQCVANGLGIFHHSIPFSWHFKSQPRCNLIYPPQATMSPNEWPWMAVIQDIDITHLINLLGDPSGASELGWNVDAVRDMIKKLKWLPDTIGQTDWTNNPEAFVAAIQQNSFTIAANNKQGVRCYSFYVREYDGKVSESILPMENCGDVYLYQKKYKEYDCMSDFISLFPLSVTQKFMEKIRGLGHRLLPYAATMNDFNNRAIDLTILSGSLMLKDTPDANGARDITQLELGGLVTFIPEDMTMDQRSFGNPAQGFVQLSQMIRSRQEANNQVFGGTDQTNQQSGITATQRKLEYGAATRTDGFESDRFYNQLTLFYRANWKRIKYFMINGDASVPAKGAKEAKELWMEVKRRGVTKEDLEVIRTVYANSMFGDGDPNQVFLAIQDLAGPISRMPLTSQKVMDKMAVSARTRKPYLAEALFEGTDPLADRELSHQTWLTSQENNAFDSDSALPVPIQDTDYTPVHVIQHLEYAEGVVLSFEQNVLTPEAALKRLVKTRDHNLLHMQVLSRDKGQRPLFADASKRWQGIENMMVRMQQMIAEAQQAEQQRQLQELKTPTLSVADQEKVLTGQVQRDELSRTEELRRTEIARTEQLKRDMLKGGAITDAQIKAIEMATQVIPRP